MISRPPCDPGIERLWRGEILARLRSTLPEADGDALTAVACGVARYCATERAGHPLSERELELFAACAFAAAGEEPRARRLALGDALYPAVSAVCGELWVLRLDRLFDAHAPCLELAVLRTLRVAVDALADDGALDAGGGLGLTGLDRLARRLAGPRASRRTVRRRADDLRSFCARALAGAAARRGGMPVPDVLRLDPAALN